MSALPTSAFLGRSLGEARSHLAHALEKAGREPARLDARLLVEAATGLDHAGLLREADRLLDEAMATRIAALGARRLRGEPLSRILGHRDFVGLDLLVIPDVLDPRPDSEAVVALAQRLISEPLRMSRLLDLGSGSGALICALLSAFETAFGIAVDGSPAACRATAENLARLGFASRSATIQGDWASAFRGPFDLIVSNPPYIASADFAALPDEVRFHDPALALDGGPDGLDAYRAILADVTRLLAPGGLLILEHGAGQQKDVASLLAQCGLAPAGSARDAGGHERAIAAFHLKSVPSGPIY